MANSELSNSVITLPARLDDITIRDIVGVVRHNLRFLLVLGFLFGGVTGTWSILQHPEFTARASFVPETETNIPTGLGSLAAQFGLSVPGGGVGSSPAFYSQLIRSRWLLGSVVATSFSYAMDSESVTGTLVEYFEIEEDDARLAHDLARRSLSSAIQVSIDRETNLLTLAVTVKSPTLAQSLADTIVSRLVRFNVETRQSRATAERTFVAERLDAATVELQQKEDSLRQFLRQNRQIGEFSEARFERDRLMRHITAAQQVVTALMQSYEQARIEEVRNTPLLTMVDRPVVPPDRNARGTVFKALLASILGGLIGVVVVIIRTPRRTT